ncbi:translation initiation factor 2 [Thermococcus sp.]|uniref:translation initiation factor 2 n=1 Tax=Thermococcus sp. TaxID=35749 RepID=UPI002608F247|nr:translation initiation factor 2 [Thermococcus sp.]
MVVIFGKYEVELGVKFGILWLIAMTPIILHIYREEWKTLSKVYPKEKAEGVADNLLVSRYMIGVIPITASLFGRWSDGNLAILGLLGLIFALIAAKLLTEAGYPLSDDEKANLLQRKVATEHDAP